ncbi:MAG: dicarboxylate/amino acid:cation symporter [Vampirovibrionales bacterium]|nr:dicarboxylate/amino acid:cation symporter [Vampirovibrionales bacterium]
MEFVIKVLMALFFGVKRHWGILLAILAGFALGVAFYDAGWSHDPRGQAFYKCFEFIGQGFIRLISMIVIPLVVSSLIVGISSLKDARQLGRLGVKVVLIFLSFMGISSALGATLAMLIQPGRLLHQDLGLITQNLHGVMSTAPIDLTHLGAQSHSLKNLFLQMIPLNPVQALGSDNLIAALVFTLLMGFALAFIGQAGRPMIALFESLFTAMMKLTDWVMMLAVPGVFALTFVTVASTGTTVFIKLLPFVGMVIAGFLLLLVVVFPLFLQLFARIDPLNLYRAVSEAMLVAFGTASSSATLPITIANSELRAGISNRIASFVLPTGASLNKTATTMFEVMAVMFLMQVYGMPLTPMTAGVIMVMAVIASIAAAGVPSAGLITMSIILNSLGQGFTVEMFAGGVALLWSIDRVLDMCRTVINVVGSVVVAAIVAANEGELKRDVLNHPETWRDTV